MFNFIPWFKRKSSRPNRIKPGRKVRFEGLESRDLLTTIINLSPVNSISSYAGVGLINNLVAEFSSRIDGVQDASPGSYTAEIDWGDGGGYEAGKVVLKGSVSSQQYQVKGSHVYSQVGSHNINVRVTGNGAMDELLRSTVEVVRQMPSGLNGTHPPANELDPEHVSLNVGGVNPFSSYKNVGFELNTIAKVNGFLNGIQNKRLDDYVAFVNWGDTTEWFEAEVGLYSSSSQPIVVKGSHVYQQLGDFDVVVFVQGPDSTSVSLESTSVHVVNLPNSLTGAPPPASPKDDPNLKDVNINVATVSSPRAYVNSPLADRLVGGANIFANGIKLTDPSQVHAVINWGEDNSWSTATVEANENSSIAFKISGSHTYKKSGLFRIVVYVSGPDGTAIADDTTSINVLKPPTPILTGSITREGTEGKPLRGRIASFDSDSTSGQPRFFKAKVKWDDGNPPVKAPIKLRGGTGTIYDIVPPPKTYNKPGKYDVVVTVKDNDGNSSEFDTTITIKPDHPDLIVAVASNRVVPTLAKDLNLNFFFGTESIQIPVDIKNIGAPPANGSATVTVYLSKQPNLNGNKVLLGSKNVTLHLASGAVQRVNLPGKIPATLDEGDKYYLVARVSSASIAEETTANNTRASKRKFEYVGSPKSKPGVFSDKDQFFDMVRRTLNNNPYNIPKSLDRSDMTALISLLEGTRPDPYIDTKGHPTIGIGLNLDTVGGQLKADLVAAVQAYYRDVRHEPISSNPDAVIRMLKNQAVAAHRRKGFAPAALSNQAMSDLFQEALPEFIAQAQSDLGAGVYNQLNDFQKAAVVSITYNLGSLSEFKGMVRGFKNDDLLVAGFNLVDSKRTTQVGKRRTGVEFANFFVGHEDLLGKVIK